MLAWFVKQCEKFKRHSAIPSPRFKAIKRVGELMYGLWYGEFAPDQAKSKALEWEWDDDE